MATNNSTECKNSSDLCPTLTTYIGYVYVQPTLCTVGIVLNTLNLIVFSRSALKTQMFFYLRTLAVCDLTSLVFLSPLGPFRCVGREEPKEQWIISFAETYVLHPMGNIFVTASILTTAALSIERCLYVHRKSQTSHHPFLESNTRCRLPFVVIATAAIAMNVPYFFNKSICEDGSMVFSDFGQSLSYSAFLWVRLGAVKVLPLVVVVIANCVLLYAVIRANFQLHHSNEDALHRSIHEQTKIRISIMLISISAVFVTCHVMEPFSYSAVYGAIHGNENVHNEAHTTQMMITNTLEIFSFTCNFIFYCIFYKPFQDTVRQFFKRCSKASVADGET